MITMPARESPPPQISLVDRLAKHDGLLASLLWAKCGESSEARHRPQFHQVLTITTKMRELAEIMAGLAMIAVNDGKLESRNPTDEDLGVWLWEMWPEVPGVRDQAVKCGTARE